jgi:hypothetical protein
MVNLPFVKKIWGLHKETSISLNKLLENGMIKIVRTRNKSCFENGKVFLFCDEFTNYYVSVGMTLIKY